MKKSIQNIIDYVLKTPENTNPTILRQQLENLSIKQPIKKGFITFYDYDGTILYSWSKEETEAATELPPLPAQKGLICQGWNWSLADIKAMGREVNVGAMYITDDGDTRVYITLSEGRTSPMMGLAVNGTVTIDWGDGTTPDTLTETSTSTFVWTPTHNYASPGDYVIRITPASGTEVALNSDRNGAYLLRYSSASDNRNKNYGNSISKIEIGNCVTSIGFSAFNNCYSLSSIMIPDGVTYIGNNAFQNCYSLSSITIPDSVTSISDSVFYGCYSLSSIMIPDSVTSIDSNAFQNCYSLSSIMIPDGVTYIGNSVFYNCYSLSSITIPDGVTYIGRNAFENCFALAKMRFLPTTPPTLSDTNAFTGIPADCVVEVPVGCLEAYQNATNYSGIASKMVEIQN